MSSGSLNIETRLAAALKERGMPVVEFAALAALERIDNASKTRLKEYFRSATQCPGETARKLWALWLEVQEMCVSVEPLRLDLRDGKQVHEWLQKRRAGQFTNFTVVA